jgi:N-acetylmuramoyl-L-alanine amidase
MKPEFIIVHCSESEWGSAREIRNWHLERGFKDIGYHFVILNGRITPELRLSLLIGSVEVGRPLGEVGAHCLGYDDNSIGICGIAKTKWMPAQEISLVVLLEEMKRMYGIPTPNILGHCETESGRREGKTCPNLDMNRIRNMVDGPNRTWTRKWEARDGLERSRG